VEIKSGSGEDGPEEAAKPKIHYAVQLALYADILEQRGVSAGRRGYIWDIQGEEALYDFSLPGAPKSPDSLWEKYLEAGETVRDIISGSGLTLPAYSSLCKGCHWYTVCTRKLRQDNDLTLIPFLGRSKRDKIITYCRTVKELAATDIAKFVIGKKTIFPGIGAETMETFQHRARLLSDPAKPGPYLKSPLNLPAAEKEIFFDIEVDPMREVCYLHGFVERRNQDNRTERYLAFYADDPTPTAEKKAFQDAWNYFKTAPEAIVYYYSKYERTIWRKLQKKYPDVAAAAEIEALFDPRKSIDLYFDVVLKKTEWPTNDFSIKTLAKYLGFAWRDLHPSGAASIEWYHRWVESKDASIKQRILDYNEDDCRATRVLLDALKML
jgi:predicted RecB family nuclease